MVCVCGNHDIGNSPRREDIEKYVATFGDDHFSFWHGGVAFLVLNSQFYEDPSHVQDLFKDHESWLEQQLAVAEASGCTHLVTFQHIPWFVNTPDEDKFYFNVEIEMRRRKLQQLARAGVKKVFCGHYHRQVSRYRL